MSLKVHDWPNGEETRFDQGDRSPALRRDGAATTLADMARHNAKFAGKHALVTGGSMGIGAALAHQLADAGADVTLVARRGGPLAATADDLRRLSPSATVRAFALDITAPDEVAGALGPELEARPIDLLVNCAGVAHVGTFASTSDDDFRALMDTNLFGAVTMTRAVLPGMTARKRGHIVNVGSILSLEGIYGYSAYSASKFALMGFSQVLRAELRSNGIGVSIALPPNTDTPQLQAELEMLPAELRRLHGASRVHSAESVAREILRGVAKGRFAIVPGRDSRMLVRAHRCSPRAMRTYVDWSIRRGLAKAPGRAESDARVELEAPALRD